MTLQVGFGVSGGLRLIRFRVEATRVQDLGNTQTPVLEPSFVDIRTYGTQYKLENTLILDRRDPPKKATPNCGKP